MGAVIAACRDRVVSIPRSAAHVGELARHERHKPAGAHGVGSLEVFNELAKEYGCTTWSIRMWVKQADRDRGREMAV